MEPTMDNQGISVYDSALNQIVSAQEMNESEETRSYIAVNEVDNHANYMKSIEISNEIEEEIYNWYTECLNRGLGISKRMFENKALFLCKEFGEQISFNKGWLDQWRKKYGVLKLPIFSDASKVPIEEQFDKRFKKLVKAEKISNDQIFTCGETGLYYKMLPTKKLIKQSKRRIPNFDITTNRVTVMACCNVSGSLKLPLLLVDKINNPKALKNIKPSNLPLIYRFQKTAWVDNAILKEWFDKEFVPRVKSFLQEKNLPQKAVLIFDNAPMHASEEDLHCGNIRSTLLHINVPSTTKLVNSEILRDLKIRYRYRLLLSLLEHQHDKIDIMERLSNVNIKDVVFWLADAWSDVSVVGIQKYWERFWHQRKFVNFEEGESMSALDLVKLCLQIEDCTEVNVKEVEKLTDKDDRAMYNLSDNEIIAAVLQNGREESASDPESLAKVYPYEAEDAIEKLMNFFESQEISSADLTTLNHLRNKIKSSQKVQQLPFEQMELCSAAY